MKLSIHKKGLIIYLIILVAVIAFASIYGGPMAFVPLYAVLLVLPFSIIYSILNYNQLNIYQEIEIHKVIRGSVHRYRLSVENTGFLPIYKMAVFAYTNRCVLSEIADGQLISLNSFEKQELTSDILCKYAGAYNVGIESILLTDPFGLYSVQLEIPYTFREVVRPPVTDVANRVLEIENLINSMGLKSESFLEDLPGSDVRPYQPGDPLHAINWKVSARLATLTVRLPEKMERRRVSMMLFPVHNPEDKQDVEFLEKRDFFLEFIISAAWHFAERQVPLRLIYPSGDITETTVDSYDSFMEFYSVVADGIFYTTDSIVDDMNGLVMRQRRKVDERDMWIIVKEAPESGEDFCTLCD